MEGANAASGDPLRGRDILIPEAFHRAGTTLKTYVHYPFKISLKFEKVKHTWPLQRREQQRGTVSRTKLFRFLESKAYFNSVSLLRIACPACFYETEALLCTGLCDTCHRTHCFPDHVGSICHSCCESTVSRPNTTKMLWSVQVQANMPT
jgi:hypothetical protein